MRMNLLFFIVAYLKNFFNSKPSGKSYGKGLLPQYRLYLKKRRKKAGFFYGFTRFYG